MEKLVPYQVTSSRTFWFRVLPLLNSKITLTEVELHGFSGLGTGFHQNSTVSKAIAKSEAIERAIYAQWKNTEISPFTQTMCKYPPPASGFAVCPTKDDAIKKAFLEWYERAVLFQISSKTCGVSEVVIPSVGTIFDIGLSFLKCNLRLFACRGPINVSLAFGFFSDGVIFGMGSDQNEHLSSLHAINECLRKSAFIKIWKARAANSPFYEAAQFWLSFKGKQRAEMFVGDALAVSDSDLQLPLQPHPSFTHSLAIGDLYVAHYWDPSWPLPEVYSRNIPNFPHSVPGDILHSVPVNFLDSVPPDFLG